MRCHALMVSGGQKTLKKRRDVKTMQVFKDGYEIVRPVEKEVTTDQTLFGGCPERVTLRFPLLQTGERLLFRGGVAFIRGPQKNR